MLDHYMNAMHRLRMDMIHPGTDGQRYSQV